MPSDIAATIIGVATSTGILSTVALCVRQFLRYRAEIERWRSIERLTDRLGLDALKALPPLARELRHPTTDAAETETGQPSTAARFRRRR